MEGTESRASIIWQGIAESEMRLWLLRELESIGVGLNDVESFNLGLINKLRSEEMKGKAERIRVKMIKDVLRIKLKDEQRYHAEMVKKRNKIRGEVGRALKVNSNPYRSFIRRMIAKSDRVKGEYRAKYKKKIEHLRKKAEERKNKLSNEIPEEFNEYDDLKIFDDEKYEKIEVGENEILIVSRDVELSDDEKSVLRLHKKFSIVKALETRDFNFEMEQAFAKLRMERKKELELEKKRKEVEDWEKELDPTKVTQLQSEEEKKRTIEKDEEHQEEQDAKSRQI